jgi:hypothetical protein
MNESVRPDEAAQALQEIGRRQEQIVDTVTIPAWYWRCIAVLMVAFAAAADTRRSLVIGIAVPVFVVGVLVATGRILLPGVRRARLRNDLLGPRGVLAILGFVFLTLALSLPTSFALDAAGVAHAAVIGVLIAALLLAFGGPVLTRYLRRVMLANRIGGSR